MRNSHRWKTKTADGDKREVRAEKFGKKWRIQAQLASEGMWVYYDTPLLEDLLELHSILWKKYQRKHLSYEDFAAVGKLIEDAGGEIPTYD
ncbi:MAG: hypothetical protein JWL59_3223 [Chthoniobacteraceae bacterium]|nr:hypothetical protein [Chthoniobacteraceae bacterium]